jgi:hypothetical protein
MVFLVQLLNQRPYNIAVFENKPIASLISTYDDLDITRLEAFNWP